MHRTRKIKLLNEDMNSELPYYIKNVTDENDRYWRKGHIYEIPHDYYINPEFIEEIEEKKEYTKKEGKK